MKSLNMNFVCLSGISSNIPQNLLLELKNMNFTSACQAFGRTYVVQKYSNSNSLICISDKPFTITQETRTGGGFEKFMVIHRRNQPAGEMERGTGTQPDRVLIPIFEF